MKNSEKDKASSVRLKSYVWALAIVWTLIIAIITMWDFVRAKEGIEEGARIQARALHLKDVIYRRWNASKGGVYAPVSELTPPNPYLSDIPERDITTLSGRRLTLINPAYMTRQVHEIGKEDYGVIGHITSLNLVRPENAPDSWESEALLAFESGQTEVSSIEEIEGKEYMRLMRPLITETVCLKCHAMQGYEEGDIRGGISVSVPMDPLRAIEYQEKLSHGLANALFWLFGVCGVILGAHWLSRGESERRKSEEEKLELEMKLERARKFKALSVLAGGVAHDLNNILSPIVGYPDLIRSQLPEETHVKENLLEIKSAAKRASNVIQDLLSLARSESYNMTLQSLNDIVITYLKSPSHMEALAKNENITVNVKLADDLFSIIGSEYHLQKVVMNLVSNAFNSMQRGGKMQIRTYKKIIDANKHTYEQIPVGEYAVLEVSDTGCGIKEELLYSLFDPFFTTQRKSNRKGTGLGLFIVYSIVKEHKGFTDVKSQVGKGSSFFLYFPVTKEK